MRRNNCNFQKMVKKMIKVCFMFVHEKEEKENDDHDDHDDKNK